MVGFLGAVSIYFVPQEPYQHFIVVAGTLSGSLLALLITTVVGARTSLPAALGWGALMGLVQSSIVFFAKGGWLSWDAPFVVPTGLVSGLILGLTVRRLARTESARASPGTS